jgi:hypothetical protein
MKPWLIFGVAAVALSCSSSAANAGTVAVRADPSSAVGDEVAFIAGPAERNRVVMSYTSDPATSWTVVDTSAVLVPGESCQAIDLHAVRCVPRSASRLQVARAVLGDMDDRLVVEGLGDYILSGDGGTGRDWLVSTDDGTSYLNGGPGDDRLRSGYGNDTLHGGSGLDDLNSGDGNDRLFDDDVDGAFDEAGPGPDLLDGGKGVDIVSYERRTTSVSVDLDNRITDEGSSEGDQLMNVESLVGGRGNDRLAGDDRHNVLDGGRGRDQLFGRGGRDELRRAEGAVSCGPGFDEYIGGRSSRDFLQPDCEVLTPEAGGYITPNPESTSRRSVSFRVRCPYTSDASVDSLVLASCGPGRLRLREAGGRRRTLARGVLPGGAWEGRLVSARLTPLGRRLAARPQGVRARLRLAGYHSDGPAMRWAIRLKVSR